MKRFDYLDAIVVLTLLIGAACVAAPCKYKELVYSPNMTAAERGTMDTKMFDAIKKAGGDNEDIRTFAMTAMLEKENLSKTAGTLEISYNGKNHSCRKEQDGKISVQTVGFELDAMIFARACMLRYNEY